MAQTQGVLPRDANNVAVQRYGLMASKTVSFTADGTVVVPIFTVKGTVLVNGLYGIVTTAIGSNHTAAHWRVNDQTVATQVISLATGTTVSSLPAGTFLSRRSLVSVALVATTSAAATLSDPVAATAPDYFMPFTVTQKTAGVQTDIEYVYTTNNSSLGTIKFTVLFTPLSDDGSVDPV
jgi:hypothetical protein